MRPALRSSNGFAGEPAGLPLSSIAFDLLELDGRETAGVNPIEDRKTGAASCSTPSPACSSVSTSTHGQPCSNRPPPLVCDHQANRQGKDLNRSDPSRPRGARPTRSGRPFHRSKGAITYWHRDCEKCIQEDLKNLWSTPLSRAGFHPWFRCPP
jgi:hypothetical protein